MNDEKKPGQPRKPHMVPMTIKIDKELKAQLAARPEKFSETIDKALRLLLKTEARKGDK